MFCCRQRNTFTSAIAGGEGSVPVEVRPCQKAFGGGLNRRLNGSIMRSELYRHLARTGAVAEEAAFILCGENPHVFPIETQVANLTEDDV
jgi:hypothetical protein